VRRQGEAATALSILVAGVYPMNKLIYLRVESDPKRRRRFALPAHSK